MRYALLATALLALAAPLAAQSSYTSSPATTATLGIAPGTEVRVTSARLGGVVDARLVQMRPGAIDYAVASDPSVRSLQWEMIDDLAVRREVTRGQRVRKGLAWGLYLGASLGGIVAPFAAYGLDTEVKDWQAIALGVGGGALAGSALGALSGPAIFSDTGWQHYRFQKAK